MRYGMALCVAMAMAAPLLASSEAGAANPFEGTIYQAVAAAIVFLVVLVVLKKAAWGRILQGLQDRENKIRGDLESAERAARDAAATLREHEAQLAGAGDEVRRIVEQGRADAQKVAGQVRDQAETEIQGLRRRAESDIMAAREQALAEIYARTASLATDVAGRILKRQISADDQDQLVNEALARLDRKEPN